MATDNANIGDVLAKVAKLLEIEEASPFKIRAYQNAADSIRFFEPPLVKMVADGEDLTKIQDVGKGIATKIEEIVAVGHEVFVERLEKEVGPGLFELLAIPGLGAKRVRVLRGELGVTSPESLLAAIEAGRLRELPGFGEKTEERLRKRLLRLRDEQEQS